MPGFVGFLDAPNKRNLFIDRFKELKTRAEVINKHIAALVFMDSFSPEDARFLIRTLGQEEGSSLYDLDYLCSFARGMDIAVGKKGSVAFGSSLTESQDKINEIINNPNDMFSDKISVPSMDSKLDFKCTQYGCTYRVVFTKNKRKNFWKQLTNNPIHDHSKRVSIEPVVKKRKLMPGENIVEGVSGKFNDQSLTLIQRLKLQNKQLEKGNKQLKQENKKLVQENEVQVG